LASDKRKVVTTKGKDAELAKWDAEVRKSVANKKTAAGPNGLTKQQQALIADQLSEEAKIRQRVVEIRANMLRGLHFIRSLVASGAEEFWAMMSDVSGLLLDNVLGKPAGTLLVGEAAIATYLVRWLRPEGRCDWL